MGLNNTKKILLIATIVLVINICSCTNIESFKSYHEIADENTEKIETIFQSNNVASLKDLLNSDQDFDKAYIAHPNDECYADGELF